MVKKYEYEVKDESYVCKIVCAGLLVAIVFLGIQVQSLNEKIIMAEEPKAILNTYTLGLYEDIDDASQMFFDYRIDNFGDVEAKNVKVRCKVFDKNDITISSVLDNAGSVSSNSIEVFEVVTDNLDDSLWEDGTYDCYIESCNNCEILYNNIPELIELYE